MYLLKEKVFKEKVNEKTKRGKEKDYKNFF